MVDLIILSNAKNEFLYQLTQNAINSVNDDRCRIIVIEQTNKKYQKAETIHIDIEFNYNKFANIGASHGTNPWIIISNNDVLFEKNWLNPLIDANHPIVSPVSPDSYGQRDIQTNLVGWKVGRHLSGWCFMIKRDIWIQIGKFDEDFNFWYADNSLVEQLKNINIVPMVVKNSVVRHLESVTLNTMNNIETLTTEQYEKFIKKYN